MPVVGVTMGAVFLGEPVSVKIVLALALVLAGFAVARVRS
jgi:drug/metabolite transporter (DMT)-like permease